MSPDSGGDPPTAKELHLNESDAGQGGAAFVTWPPPGLERTQGDLLRIAGSASLAGIVLVLPLVFTASRTQDFATFGPFADAWWVMLALATVGLAFALDALARTARALRRAGRARRGGYQLAIIAQVLCDSGRDMGFLLSGARHFSVVDEREREAIVAIRIFSAILLTASGLWLVAGFPVGLYLAARGMLTPGQLIGFTVAPAAVGYAFGGVAAVVQDGRVRRARRVWHRQPWSADLASDEIAAWHAAAPGGARSVEPEGSYASVFLSGGVLAGVLAVLVVIPVLTLAPASAVAPILTTVAAPSFDSYRPRAARAEAYRSYVVDGDVTISAAAAGQLLHDLMYVGVDTEPPPGEKAPSVRFDTPWFVDDTNEGGPFGIDRHLWSDSLIPLIARGATAEQLTYLDEISNHPASSYFSRLASATALDAGSARWETPFPPGTTMATIPVPRFGAFRRAADVHIAKAARAFAAGRFYEADMFLREVITVGYLLADDGPTLIDNLIGVTIIEGGGTALAELYRAAGLVDEAATLSRLTLVAERAAGRLPSRFSTSPEGFVNALPALVLDETGVRGFRWEYFINLTTIAPCMNVHRMVFGPGTEYDDFIEEARAALVRFPSDEALFELARYGWVGGAEASAPSLLTRIASIYMNTDDNSCAAMVRHMELGEGL